jgi:hypothetical protein
MERQIPTIVITAKKVRPGSENDDFPEVVVFGVELSREKECWLESWATEMELRAFLRGIQAGSAMTGGPHVPLPPEMPQTR